jgi:hypothetical protein
LVPTQNRVPQLRIVHHSRLPGLTAGFLLRRDRRPVMATPCPAAPELQPMEVSS